MVCAPRPPSLLFVLATAEALVTSFTHCLARSLPQSDVHLTFPEPLDAQYALETLQVDAEIQPEKIRRTLAADGVTLSACVSIICCLLSMALHEADCARCPLTLALCMHSRAACSHFEATEIRLLRAAVSSYYDMTLLVARTLLEFKE